MSGKERKSILLAATIVFALIVCGETRSAAFAETVLKMGGSGFGLGIVKVLAEVFEKAHPGARIKVFPSLGSYGGIEALLQGALDIAVSSRPLKEEEKSRGGSAFEVLRSPYVFITNSKVSKHVVTIRELEKIYSGRMKVWPDGMRIRLVLRPETETDTKIVKGISPAMEQAVKSALSREGMILAITDQESAHAVENIPGALGGSTLTQILTEKRRVNILSFNGVKPSAGGLGDGAYPLSKSLYLVTSPKTPKAARQFIEFVCSKEGRKIMEKYENMVIVAGQGNPQ